MDGEVQLPLYLFKIYMCEDLSSQIWSSCAFILEVVKVQWPDDVCLSLWAWMSILKLIWFGVLPTLLKMTNLATNNTHGHGNLLPLSFSSLLQAPKKLWSIILPQIKTKSNKTKESWILASTKQSIIVNNKGKKDICLVDGQSTRVKCNSFQLHSLAKFVTNEVIQVAN